MTLKTTLVSSLEKTFTKTGIKEEGTSFSTALKGEILSFQLACFLEDNSAERVSHFTLEIESELKDNINFYIVKEIPVRLPAYQVSDDYYISKDAGLYPDVLERAPWKEVTLTVNNWKSFWFEVNIPENIKAGVYPITVTLKKGDFEKSETFTLEVIDAVMPKQDLICTHWFHYDCLASWYKVPVFSEEHWEIIENYIKAYRKYGSNMILTPVITPALDTDVGAERLTAQLVDITFENNEYSFGFDKLARFIDLAHKYDIEYFEIAHLFTQWGAEFAPKVVDIKGNKLFGWETKANSDEYKYFLKCFLTALKAFLKDKGILDKCYFHISDEPYTNHLENYKSAKDSVIGIIGDCHMVDALSHYEFYDMGLVKTPVCATNAIEPFIKNKVENLWAYYCCSQGNKNVSNGFIPMPSARTRILGLQLFKYNIKGSLQWGYIFWYGEHSRYEIDPYLTADGDETWPAGDPFLVYPGFDKNPVLSLRLLVFNEAIQDLRALNLLASFMGRDETIKWLEKLSGQEITFSSYPLGRKYLLFIREEINKKIKEFLK